MEDPDYMELEELCKLDNAEVCRYPIYLLGHDKDKTACRIYGIPQ
jgi:hypothetical protein